MGEKYQPIGFSGSEIKRDGAHPFGIPFGQTNVGLGCLKADGIQRSHILTYKLHFPIDLHLSITNPCQARQLQTNIVILINNLSDTRKNIIHQSCIQYKYPNYFHPWEINFSQKAVGSRRETMQESDMMTEGESRTRSMYRNDSNGHSVMTID